MKKIAAFLAFVLSTAAFAAPLSDAEKAEFVPKNILVNSGAENLTQGWTATGGTFTTTATLSNVRAGKRAFSWDSNGAGQIVSSPSSLVNGLAGSNGAAQIRIKTPSGTATHKLQVYDGTNVIAEQTVLSTTSYSVTSTNFIFPSSGSVRIRLVSVAANEPLIYFDEGALGEHVLVQMSQANIAGAAYFELGTVCQWSVTSVTPAPFSPVSACFGPTIEESNLGSWQTTDTDLPRWTINNLPPGKYEAIVTGINLGSGGQNANFTISDGTTVSGEGIGMSAGGGSYAGQVTIHALFTYAAAGNRTFEVYGSSLSGSAAIGTDTNRLRLVLKRFPLATEQGVTASTSAGVWAGSLASSAVWSTTSTSFVDGTNAGPFVLTERTNTLFGSVVQSASPQAGVTFTPTSAGDYSVCMYSNAATSSNAQASIYQLWDGANELALQYNNEINAAPLTMCGIYKAVSIAPVSIWIRLKSAGGGATATLAPSGASVDIVIKKVTQQVPAPVLVGSVITPSAGVEKLIRMRTTDSACVSSPCTLSDQSGTEGSIVRTGGGLYELTFPAGTFSAAPSCVATAMDTGAGAVSCYTASGNTATVFSLFCLKISTATNEDTALNVICQGPK